MLILLVGKGHLGSYLQERLETDQVSVYWWKEDLAQLTENDLKTINPNCVINTAGKTDLTWCESNATEAWRCNVVEPLYLMRKIKSALGSIVPLIHTSSGCVWTGPYDSDGKPFTARSPVSPACFYAWTKSAADSMMADENATFDAMATPIPLYILRPRQVYSPMVSPRNTLSKLKMYHGLINSPNSMTSAETILKTILKIIEIWKAGHGSDIPEVINVYDKGEVTPLKVGMLLYKAGARSEPEVLEKNQLDSWHKPRRVDVVMYDEWLEKNVDVPEVDTELQRVIGQYAENIKKEGPNASA
jgi:dTDP-4-dehydrorhamnose reductase